MTTTTAPTRITAKDIQVGDLIQHHLRRWEAQTVTAKVETLPGFYNFELSGGSRIVMVPAQTSFLRYQNEVAHV
jgi:hypothetical protein